MMLLRELQAWFQTQCDGDWEHGHGVRIESLDNPGWMVVIELAGTPLEGKEFPDTSYGLSNGTDLKINSDGLVDVGDPDYQAAIEFLEDPNWLTCAVKEGRFEGFGGPEKLEEIIATFLRWSADNN